MRVVDRNQIGTSMNSQQEQQIDIQEVIQTVVDGQELNRVYERLDDGSDPERCRIRLREEIMVEPGRGICLMPTDIHSIHTTGDRPTRHLHMYGLALEKLDDRKAYDPESGQIIPYNRNFMKPTVQAQG